jgi:hypothetical protein
MEEVLALKEAKWKAENEALRASLAEAGQQRLRESTAQWQQAAAAAAIAVPPGEQVQMVAELWAAAEGLLLHAARLRVLVQAHTLPTADLQPHHSPTPAV